MRRDIFKPTRAAGEFHSGRNEMLILPLLQNQPWQYRVSQSVVMLALACVHCCSNVVLAS
jgi:hypothetical protein